MAPPQVGISFQVSGWGANSGFLCFRSASGRFRILPELTRTPSKRACSGRSSLMGGPRCEKH